MAYDDILYRAKITSNGTAVLSLIKGPGTIRAGYGVPRLVSVRAYYHSDNTSDKPQVEVEYKNTNWTRSNKLYAAQFNDNTAQARNTYNYVYGHSYPVLVNSAFIISAKAIGTITGNCYVDVIITIDYDAVPAINPDSYAGCPITFTMTENAGVTGGQGTQIRLGSFDVFDPGITYAINEVSTTNADLGMAYLVIEGFQAQRGLSRILPLPSPGAGIIPTILGSVQITKQSFELSIISDTDVSAQIVPINMEVLASSNSIGGQ